MRRENREAAQLGSRYQEPRRQLLQAEHVVGDTKSSSKNKAANPKCKAASHEAGLQLLLFSRFPGKGNSFLAPGAPECT